MKSKRQDFIVWPWLYSTGSDWEPLLHTHTHTWTLFNWNVHFNLWKLMYISESVNIYWMEKMFLMWILYLWLCLLHAWCISGRWTSNFYVYITIILNVKIFEVVDNGWANRIYMTTHSARVVAHGILYDTNKICVVLISLYKEILVSTNYLKQSWNHLLMLNTTNKFQLDWSFPDLMLNSD